ncbi:Monosaccharide ABC transporter membrane protein, CUT2 family [metagenome]|uniref:Monosaccharide ABC transporter membrane protein, CUT2 family n=1 Tax=metagenome TaxID=256318 RepID=A0A2P2C417_9ZZZZ
MSTQPSTEQEVQDMSPSLSEESVSPDAKPSDERLGKRSLVRVMVARPGFGAVVGVVLVFAFFAVGSDLFASAAGASNWLDPSATIGLLAITVALLMVGGEFDLSTGVMIGSSSLLTGLLVTESGLSLPVALLISLAFAVGVGFFNGFLVARTQLPSFIVTLGTFFILQGLNQGVVKQITGTVRVDGLSDAQGYAFFQKYLGSTVNIGGVTLQSAVFWWVGFTIIGAVILSRTKYGNWIQSVGGDLVAARGMGVPVRKVKVALFIASSVMAWFVGTITALRLGSVTTNQGVGQELVFIVAAVVGGCLLTGGAGSVIGASAAALIFGMVQVGIPYRGWDSNYYYAFLGGVLLLSVLGNTFIRNTIGARR